MKRLLSILLALTFLFFTACAVPASQQLHAEQDQQEILTPVPSSTPSFADLLADALHHYEAGDYEEAILYYEMAIEIEPKNFDAQFGLGKTYRAAKLPEKAVVALESAVEMNANNRDALVELGYAYLDAGNYTQAEALAKPLWEKATPDMEAGVVFLMSLAAQQRVEEVKALLENEGLSAYLTTLSAENNTYIGQYNEKGERHGKGVGLYGGANIYIGDYENGVRSGQGFWRTKGPSVWIFIGTWANDAPNGYGEFYRGPHYLITGNFLNGLEHGDMQVTLLTDDTICSQPHSYKANEGIYVIVEHDNYGGGTFALCSHVDRFGGLTVDANQVNKKQGVPIW